MDTLDKIYIWFSMSELEIASLYEILSLYDNTEDLFYIDKYNGKISYILSGQEFQKFIDIRDRELNRVINYLENGKINFVTLNSTEYPRCFRNLDYPPFVIYYRGDLSLLEKRSIAVLGSRVCTRYGKEQSERFAEEFVKEGFVLVTGLTEGIETYAVTKGLNVGGKVICIMANGLKSVYPAENLFLAKRIFEEGGLLISENYPDFKPIGMSFVQRNRLIPAVAEAILIVEAGAKSGSLYTVNFALDMGRDIFALPGNCNSSASAGSNDLIKRYYCACVTAPSEVIETLNTNYIENNNKSNINNKSEIELDLNLNPLEKTIYDFVKIEEKHFDEILEKTQIETKKLLVVLTTMEIRGLIRKLPGNYFSKKD